VFDSPVLMGSNTFGGGADFGARVLRGFGV
jgi:hypothetical protein